MLGLLVRDVSVGGCLASCGLGDVCNRMLQYRTELQQASFWMHFQQVMPNTDTCEMLCKSVCLKVLYLYI